MGAPVAQVLLGVACAALPSTFLRRLCLTACEAPAWPRVWSPAPRLPARPCGTRMRVLDCELPGRPRGELCAPKSRVLGLCAVEHVLTHAASVSPVKMPPRKVLFDFILIS